ncbi:bifunctional diacylglycerol diphosphate phosphatase/phosphatidate phosphatase [Homalodisca vitripennis]|nr:bifunctional diacylglycerol diphosphate phosphatase/phosphatidate phosphatase [Homalodisca vitripennis]
MHSADESCFTLRLVDYRQPLFGRAHGRISRGVGYPEALLVYACGVFANSGNYKGFGDSKIIPGLPQEKLEEIVQVSGAYSKQPKLFKSLWDNCKSGIYSLNDKDRSLGFWDKGVTTYFSSNCTIEDSKIIKAYLTQIKMEAYNCRTFKTTEEGKTVYEPLGATGVGVDPRRQLVQTIMNSPQSLGSIHFPPALEPSICRQLSSLLPPLRVLPVRPAALQVRHLSSIGHLQSRSEFSLLR